MNPAFRILVVDDVTVNRRLLVRSLETEGYELAEASSGAEALELAVADRPDLVLLDVDMPGMDGFALCESLKATKGLEQVPVIFVTCHVGRDEVERAFAVGGSDYVVKPFHIGEVRARVAVHLQLRRVQAELEDSHAQLLRSQKLESIGSLAAGIAHEINTPTQYVGDNARFLQDAFADLLPLLDAYERLAEEAASGAVTEALRLEVARAAEQADLEYLRDEIPKSIAQSLDGIERVSSIVRAMKEFSHPGVEEMTRIDLNRALESTATVCRNEWKYLANVEFELDPDLPTVPCLPGEINQVFLNIIVNAAHAIEGARGGEVEELGTITITTRAAGDVAEIRIQDDGTGIPEEIRERLFDPFFTTKGVGKGTGQGLAIAHAVVTQKHGGTIEIETECGVGTAFVIRLPLEAARVEPSSRAA